jgi:hypothetical protein
MTYENLPEVSEDEDCRVSLIPADDGGAYFEIEMSDELAERFEAGAAEQGLSREEYFRYLMNGGIDEDHD